MINNDKKQFLGVVWGFLSANLHGVLLSSAIFMVMNHFIKPVASEFMEIVGKQDPEDKLSRLINRNWKMSIKTMAVH